MVAAQSAISIEMNHRQSMDAALAMMAAAQSEDNTSLRGISARLPKLATRLSKFSFPTVALPLAGLLVLPENHPASLRIRRLNSLVSAVLQWRQSARRLHNCGSG